MKLNRNLLISLAAAFLLAAVPPFLATAVMAQPDGPPPRRGSPERRAQRVERLRKLGGQIGDLVESLGNDPTLNPPRVDVPKVNEGIAALIEPLLTEEGGLQSLRLQFDPAETNLARDRARLIGSAQLRRSSWSMEPTSIDLDLRASMERREDGRPRGTLDGRARVQTDVIALGNRAIARLKEKLERPARGAASGGPPNADETFRLRTLEKLERTPPLQTMDDLVDMLTYLSGLRLTATNDRVDELKSRAAAVSDERLRSRLLGDLAEVRQQRDQMFDVRPNVERDADGRAVALTYTMTNSQWSNETQIEQFRLAISQRELTLKAVGATGQGMELYSLFKPLVLNTLARIQSRDPDTMRWGRGVVNDSVGRFRGMLGPTEELPPPQPAPQP
ncbi:MAG TPA: hypothetical protein VJ783_30265 [Pirellulales bacterium]|nr:hypothetical protein [Pirellulales bacterium]